MTPLEEHFFVDKFLMFITVCLSVYYIEIRVVNLNNYK